MPDWLVVGAGFTGAVFAERLATTCDAKVLVIDRRNHIAGNAFDPINEHGVRYHAYGPHIFHTNSAVVAEYLSRFTEWRAYEHRVVGRIDGKLIPIPFNLTSLEMLFPEAEARRLKALLIEGYGMETRVPILKLRESGNAELRNLAGFIYENVFAGYTKKQWGLSPEEISPSVTARVPVAISYDDRYFQDSFQRMPLRGYAAIFERMLSHPNIELSLATDYDSVNDGGYERVLFTGAIDAFFDFALGELPYRSMRFAYATHPGSRCLPVATMNYPTSEDFTRITEMGHLTGEWGEMTTLATEYPGAHRPGENEPHYPIPRDENRALYSRYAAFAKREAPHVIFAGRLGDYSYYNMDQAIARALSLFAKVAAK
jgi:UDP-galactopyranose mutase